MRLLLLHTDEAIRSVMPDLLRDWLAKSPQPRTCNIRVEDGNSLDYPRVVSLLKEGFDCILINLRLPAMLSVRIAELVQLAKIPARLVLVSGAPQDLASALSLYDGCIRVPFYDKSAEASLEESLGRPLLAQHRLLPTQEHLDIAILNLLHNYAALAPGCRGALHAFGLYRDAYLHRPSTATPEPSVSSRAVVNQRIDLFAEVTPLNFSQRVCAVIDCVNQSRFYLPNQKRFLAYQLNYLLDTIGLTLMNFRKETEEVLAGLEQFGRMAQDGGAGLDSATLRDRLLARSTPMRYLHQGITQIVGLLPGTGSKCDNA
jgi:CheY-like chemotaxis protein